MSFFLISGQVPITKPIDLGLLHGLIIYKDTKAKCRPIKKWPVRGLCGRFLSEFIDCRNSQSCWHFRPSFVNCCPSTFSLVQLPLPPSLKYILYTYTVCKGRGVWGSGSSYRWIPAAMCRYRSIFEMTTFCIAFFESNLPTAYYLVGVCLLTLPHTSMFRYLVM